MLEDPEDMPENVQEDEDEVRLRKRSLLREDVEAALARSGFSLECRIGAVNMETGEAHYFDSYQEVLDFMKGRKGRWYVTTPGLRHTGDAPKK